MFVIEINGATDKTDNNSNLETLAISKVELFAKAVNESVIEDVILLIVILLESTKTSKFAVKSTAVKFLLLIKSATLLVDRARFESFVELTSIVELTFSRQKGENKIRPIFAKVTYSLDSKTSISSFRIISSFN